MTVCNIQTQVEGSKEKWMNLYQAPLTVCGGDILSLPTGDKLVDFCKLFAVYLLGFRALLARTSLKSLFCSVAVFWGELWCILVSLRT